LSPLRLPFHHLGTSRKDYQLQPVFHIWSVLILIGLTLLQAEQFARSIVTDNSARQTVALRSTLAYSS
jgi:hypothetical protein